MMSAVPAENWLMICIMKGSLNYLCSRAAGWNGMTQGILWNEERSEKFTGDGLPNFPGLYVYLCQPG